MDITSLLRKDPLLGKMAREEEVFWTDPDKTDAASALSACEITRADVRAAEDLLLRFAPVIRHYFPETEKSGGIIESPLTEIPAMQRRLVADAGVTIPGRVFLKRDSDLAVAGSVKARGGIYEVLLHAETLALEAGLLSDKRNDYMKLISPAARELFGKHKIQVGSTGNLGLSIGVMSAALGFEAVVHMSADAKQWKKDLLRQRGATVLEYAGDYGEAVKNGRARSDADPRSYFVDDENSRALFCGYAVAGERLRRQLTETGIRVDEAHPLFVYLPCGVGGAPCGITFGLKLAFGDWVHCFFAEPAAAPCLLLGAVTGLYENISVQDIGLSGKTLADGLAVGRCSAFAAKAVRGLISGEATVPEADFGRYLKMLYETEGIFIEPSACAGFRPLQKLFTSREGRAYLAGISSNALQNAAHIVWATGGSLVPPPLRKELLR